MNKYFVSNANIVCKDKILYDRSLLIESGKIKKITAGKINSPDVIDAGGNYLCAGFIDMHVHGGNGSDFMDATESDFENIASYHAVHGTTSLLCTTVASSDDELFAVLDCFNNYAKTRRRGANILGIHLEGPYFSYNQRGAQNEKYLKAPSKEHIGKILSKSNRIMRWSAAPELDNGYILADICNKNNILLSMAHSGATCEQGIDAFNRGYKLITHFYSGMNGVTRKDCYRIGGLVETGYLTDGLSVEIIADGSHLPKCLIELIVKIKNHDKIALITDCIRASGVSGNNLTIGGSTPITVKNGVAFLADFSSFAGSIATADQLINTMLDFTGLPIYKIISMITAAPAELLNLKNKGVIKEGADADFVIFSEKNRKIKIEKVAVNGIFVKQ